MYDPDLHLLVDDEEFDARWHLRRVLARPERLTTTGWGGVVHRSPEGQ